MAIYLPSIRQLPAASSNGFGGSGLVRKEQLRKIQQGHDEICLTSQYFGAGMDPFTDDDIAQLLGLKRYKQPPPAYFENFLSEFRRRQRDELRRQPLWSVCVDRAHDFVFRHNVRLLAAYPAGIAVVVTCAAVISIRIYQQPEHVQVAVESSPVPSTRPANAEREFNLAPPVMPRTFNAELILLPRSRDVPLLPTDALGSDQFVPLYLEWESRDDQSLQEK